MNRQIFNAVKNAFDANPKASLLHATIDGQCFFTPSDATRHSLELVKAGKADQTGYVKVFRDQVEALAKQLDEMEAEQAAADALAKQLAEAAASDENTGSENPAGKTDAPQDPVEDPAELVTDPETKEPAAEPTEPPAKEEPAKKAPAKAAAKKAK